mmetsp:Transcript_7099/g.15656  ORF Transcript_7099/g.15656 Transcript_7099/m.15656 type:complete len:285 (-) Transcript_7099:233-1087(-)
MGGTIDAMTITTGIPDDTTILTEGTMIGDKEMSITMIVDVGEEKSWMSLVVVEVVVVPRRRRRMYLIKAAAANVMWMTMIVSQRRSVILPRRRTMMSTTRTRGHHPKRSSNHRNEEDLTPHRDLDHTLLPLVLILALGPLPTHHDQGLDPDLTHTHHFLLQNVRRSIADRAVAAVGTWDVANATVVGMNDAAATAAASTVTRGDTNTTIITTIVMNANEAPSAHVGRVRHRLSRRCRRMVLRRGGGVVDVVVIVVVAVETRMERREGGLVQVMAVAMEGGGSKV